MIQITVSLEARPKICLGQFIENPDLTKVYLLPSYRNHMKLVYES